MTFVQPPPAPARPALDPWGGVPAVEPLAVRAQAFTGDDDVRLVPTGAPYAGWWRRAAALVADGLAHTPLMAVAVLAAELLVAGSAGSGGAAAESGAATSADSALVGAILLSWVVLLVMQAYSGSTPGKLVLGIAVVRLDTLRPAGLPRTLLRQLAHVLDNILLIGYLRPMWHRRGQTFADSVMRTIVLRTRRPLGHPALRHGSREPEWMPLGNEAARVGTGRTVLTVLSVGLIALGAAGAGPVLVPVVVEVARACVELMASYVDLAASLL